MNCVDYGEVNYSDTSISNDMDVSLGAKNCGANSFVSERKICENFKNLSIRFNCVIENLMKIQL